MNVTHFQSLIADKLTSWSIVVFQNLTANQLVKNSTHFMETEDSLPYSRGPTTGSWSNPVESMRIPHTLFP
jgi:hypothetical protein